MCTRRKKIKGLEKDQRKMTKWQRKVNWGQRRGQIWGGQNSWLFAQGRGPCDLLNPRFRGRGLTRSVLLVGRLLSEWSWRILRDCRGKSLIRPCPDDILTWFWNLFPSANLGLNYYALLLQLLAALLLQLLGPHLVMSWSLLRYFLPFKYRYSNNNWFST